MSPGGDVLPVDADLCDANGDFKPILRLASPVVLMVARTPTDTGPIRSVVFGLDPCASMGTIQ